MDVNYKGVVVAKNLWVREGPAISFRGIKTIPEGTQLSIREMENGSVHHQYGWSMLKESDGTFLIKITEYGEKIGSETVSVEQPEEPVKEDTTSYSYYSLPALESVVTDEDQISSDFIKSVRGIHGMPYQFMPSVDKRAIGSNFGRKFTEKIITRMPLLLITPGKPKFMKAFSIKEKEDIFKFLTKKPGGAYDELLNREGRFYDIEFNYKDYYDYVNPMAQMTARLLNLQNQLLDGTPLDKYKWQNYTNSAFKTFLSAKESVAFYIDSETQISESFSNNTGESMLANKANSLSDMGREIQFLLGGTAGVQFDKMSQENYDSTLQEFDNFSAQYLKMAPESLISKLGSGFLTVASGGKMVFPEIWNDSNFSKNYSINIKLTTPDFDPFSWYMNICIPLLHLIALVAPQQMGANAYKTPFIVRAFYKGFFNCDMGIITNMNINKGDKSKWTLNGLPTEINVSFEIKDLYQIMTITKQTEIMHLMNNTALMDYLANMCGINIAKPDVMRTLEIYLNQIENYAGLQGRFSRGFLSAEQSFSNMMRDIFGVFGVR